MSKDFGRGMGFMAGLWLMSHALHWFITPAAYSASDGRNAAVAAQALVGLGIAVVAWISARRASRASEIRR